MRLCRHQVICQSKVLGLLVTETVLVKLETTSKLQYETYWNSSKLRISAGSYQPHLWGNQTEWCYGYQDQMQLSAIPSPGAYQSIKTKTLLNSLSLLYNPFPKPFLEPGLWAWPYLWLWALLHFLNNQLLLSGCKLLLEFHCALTQGGK